MSQPLLTLRNICKSFGGTRALVDGQLDLHAGQVTALIGENGAGKSTLVKVLTGVHQPDSGVIGLAGRKVRIASPAAAQKLGISVIHQESVVFDDLSVAENIFVTAHPRRHGRIDWPTMRQQAARILAQLETTIGPSTPMRDLGVAQKHLVQIARALCHDAQVVIMDEPTAALSHHEAEELLRIVRRLKQGGCAVLFISHKFEEIFAIADRYVVYRDGATVGAGLIKETTVDNLITLMVGRSVQNLFPGAASGSAKPGSGAAGTAVEILRVENLCRDPEFADISFSLYQGEILGVYGLVGSGRSELMQALFGLAVPHGGRIIVGGKAASITAADEAIRLGLAYVPEDRQQQGAVLSLSIQDNIALASLRPLAVLGFTSRSKTRRTAERWMEKLQIRAAGAAQAVEQLSGGNQQKVVLGKWLETAPKILILDEPTKGIDVGSKVAVYQLVSDLARRGVAVILVSSDLPEVLGMANRVLVMRRGRLRACFDRAECDAKVLVRAATDA